MRESIPRKMMDCGAWRPADMRIFSLPLLQSRMMCVQSAVTSPVYAARIYHFLQCVECNVFCRDLWLSGRMGTQYAFRDAAFHCERRGVVIAWNWWNKNYNEECVLELFLIGNSLVAIELLLVSCNISDIYYFPCNRNNVRNGVSPWNNGSSIPSHTDIQRALGLLQCLAAA